MKRLGVQGVPLGQAFLLFKCSLVWLCTLGKETQLPSHFFLGQMTLLQRLGLRVNTGLGPYFSGSFCGLAYGAKQIRTTSSSEINEHQRTNFRSKLLWYNQFVSWLCTILFIVHTRPSHWQPHTLLLRCRYHHWDCTEVTWKARVVALDSETISTFDWSFVKEKLKGV